MNIGVALALASALAAPSHVTPGESFKVPPARHANVSYYLSRDSRRSDEDIRLIGPRKARVFVPAAPAASYRLLACTGSHCVAGHGQVTVADGKPTQIVAFGDSRDTNDQYLASNLGWTPAVCPAAAAARRLPSLAGALDSAHELLARAAGPKGLAQFQASAAYRNAANAETAAVEAVALKEPGAALAALLRAHDLAPDEPRYLVGAAAILTGLDHPAEALALVNGADRMPPSRSAPFGINVQALALNAKGE